MAQAYNKKRFEKRYFFKGEDLTSCNDTVLVQEIQQLEADIKELETINAAKDSKKIQKFIKNAHRDLAKLVEYLDNR